MSVDYYQCDSCNIGYRDDSQYACACECGANFCSLECGKLDNYADPANQEEPDEDDSAYQDYIDGNCRIDKNKHITCLICRKEKFTDYGLLHVLMEHFNLTYEQVIEIAKKQD